MEEDRILKLAIKHGLHFKKNVQINGLGLDFLVAFAEDLNGLKWVMRIPRRTDLLTKIEQESKILSFIKTRVKFDTPNWLIQNSELIAYPLLANPPALSVDVVTHDYTWNIDKDSPSFATSLGTTLAELHRISNTEAESFGFDLKTPDLIRSSLLEEINLIKNELGVNSKLESRWRAWINNKSLWPSFSSFTHGDLYAGHTLVDTTGQITGIIDWSEAGISDPSIDFVGHFMTFGEESLIHVLDSYEKAGGRIWEGMKQHIIERSAISPLKFASFALSNKNQEQIEEARKQLNQIV